MPVSQEQRAMLQLLLERGQSYEDIGSLLGLSTDDVRARSRSALTEIAGEDPDRDVALTDYLLGQADPISRAEVARQLQVDPSANALAQKLLAQLRLLAPAADLPSPPPAKAPVAETPAPAPAAAPAAGQPAAATSAGGTGLSSRQRRLIGALLGGGVVVALVVLLATGAFSGGGGGNEGNAAAAANGSSNGGGQSQNQVTKAVLLPPNGGDARGVAIFGRVRNVPVIEVRAVSLDPSPKGENYSVWLYKTDKVTLRVGGVRVTKSGRILTQIPVPAQALGFVANGTFDSIVLTLTKDADFQAEVAKAKKAKRLPSLTGTKVLEGKVTGPAVQGASSGAGGTTGGGGGSGG